MAMKIGSRLQESSTLAPCKLSSVTNTLVIKNDSAGKRKRNSPLKRRDSNETGSSTAYTPTGANARKRRKTKALANNGSIFVYLDLSPSLDLDHCDNILEDYLRTDPEAVHNSQSFSGDSALDQSGRTFASEALSLKFITSTAGTSDNPIIIESSPEKKTEALTEVPMCSSSHPRRNPVLLPPPPKSYGERKLIHRTGVTCSRDNGHSGLGGGTTYIFLGEQKFFRFTIGYHFHFSFHFLTLVNFLL